MFSLALCLWLSRSKVLFWPGARLSDGPSLAGLWFSLAAEVLLTALCPERATVFRGADFLFPPSCGRLTMRTPRGGAQGVTDVPWAELSPRCPACHHLSPYAPAPHAWAHSPWLWSPDLGARNSAFHQLGCFCKSHPTLPSPEAPTSTSVT